MPRTYERKTVPAQYATLRMKDVPSWAQELVTEPEQLKCLDQLRYEVGSCASGKLPLVGKLVEAARRECRRKAESANGQVVLELLDLVPGIIEYCDQYPWVRRELRSVFTARAYDYFTVLKKKVGKVPSDIDERRAGAVRFVLDTREGRETATQVRRRSESKVIAAVAEVENVSGQAVAQSVKRYKIKQRVK